MRFTAIDGHDLLTYTITPSDNPAPLPTVTFQDPLVVVNEGSTAALTIARGDDGGVANLNVGE